MFRGRENAHTQLGFEVINRIIQETVDITTVDQAPRQQGRFVTAILVPKKAKKIVIKLLFYFADASMNPLNSG